MARRTVVIVGGALAGPTAAARAREVDEHARIVLLERAPSVSYAVSGLAPRISGEVAASAMLDSEGPGMFREVYDVEVRTGIEVRRIDARRRSLATSAGSVRYDALVYAAGVESVMPAVPGLAGARNVLALRTPADLRQIEEALRGGRRVLVLGGGFFGVEAADALLRRGASVLLVERGPRLLPTFAPAAAEAARTALSSAGAEVVLGATLESVSVARGSARAARVAGRDHAVDLVIVAAGVRPRTELLDEAGAALQPDGSVLVDERCRTTLPEIWAGGTCVALEHAVSRRPVWLPQAAIADKTAQVAGAAAAGGTARMGVVLGTAIVRAGALTLARTGLPQHEVPEALVSRVHPYAQDPFLPGSTRLAIELAADRHTGRLLGADVWGPVGVDKRVDVLATAIAGGLDVDALAGLDLAYAPTYSRARDAANVAGAVAAADLAEPTLAFSPAEIARRAGRVLLVDVREAHERAAGVIAESRSISLGDLRKSAGRLAKAGRPVVFVSSDGSRGYLAARLVRARGVAGAGYLSGGIASWRAEGRPLSREPRS